MSKSGSNDLVLPLIAILVKSDGAGKLILMVHLIVMAWASNFTKLLIGAVVHWAYLAETGEIQIHDRKSHL